MTYQFKYAQLKSGSKRRLATGTVKLRAADDVVIDVHADTLYDTSGLYRGMVDDGVAAGDALDVRAANLEPWQVDYFLGMAYNREFDLSDIPAQDRLEGVAAVLAYFDASDDIYATADDIKQVAPDITITTICFIVGANRLLDILLRVDPVRFKMPRVYKACMRALQMHAMLEADFGVIFTRRDDLKRLSHDTLIDMMHMHTPLRYSTKHGLELRVLSHDEYEFTVPGVKDTMTRPFFDTHDNIEFCTAFPGLNRRTASHANGFHFTIDKKMGQFFLVIKFSDVESMTQVYMRGVFDFRDGTGDVVTSETATRYEKFIRIAWSDDVVARIKDMTFSGSVAFVHH